ncbi:MAG: acyl carrier protein [Clostridia bacterium]|nr:acyl carrier protein [Clostridia bacterium]
MIEKIEKIIKDNIEIENLQIDSTTSFRDDLGLDSFEMSQLLCALEDEMNIELNDSDIVKINTVADLISFIEKN